MYLQYFKSNFAMQIKLIRKSFLSVLFFFLNLSKFFSKIVIFNSMGFFLHLNRVIFELNERKMKGSNIMSEIPLHIKFQTFDRKFEILTTIFVKYGNPTSHFHFLGIVIVCRGFLISGNEKATDEIPFCEVAIALSDVFCSIM